MIKITRFFYIHFLVFPLLLIAYFSGTIHTLLMAYAIVSVHELSHLFAALILKVRIGSVIVMPFGITLRLSGAVIKNPAKEILIAIAGPLANAVMLIAGILIKKKYIWAEQSIFLYEYINWVTMLLNLIPALPLDGGRIVRAILAHSLGYLTGMSIMRRITKAVAATFVIVSIALIFIFGINISLIMIAAFLIFNMIEERKTSDLFVFRELLKSKEKLLEHKLMSSKIISVTENTKAKYIFSKISYDRFNLIYILNEDNGRIISESELIDAVMKRGYGIKMKHI